MDDLDLYYEAQECRRSENVKIMRIGDELFKLYDKVYNNNYNNDDMHDLLDYNIWDIYTDIWMGLSYDDSFNKRYAMDGKYDADAIEASVVDGLLTLSVPYKAEVKPKKIKVS